MKKNKILLLGLLTCLISGCNKPNEDIEINNEEKIVDRNEIVKLVENLHDLDADFCTLEDVETLEIGEENIAKIKVNCNDYKFHAITNLNEKYIKSQYRDNYIISKYEVEILEEIEELIDGFNEKYETSISLEKIYGEEYYYLTETKENTLKNIKDWNELKELMINGFDDNSKIVLDLYLNIENEDYLKLGDKKEAVIKLENYIYKKYKGISLAFYK